MTVSFDPHGDLIIVPVEVVGPSRTLVLHLAVDTGATVTLVNEASLINLGYDPTQFGERVEILTASGIEYATPIVVSRLTAIGQERTNFAVLCQTLPSSVGVDGLLGLDFMRGQTLTIDFRSGQIGLT